MRLRRMMVLVSAFWMLATLVPTNASASDFRIRIEDITDGGNGWGVVVTDDQLGDAWTDQLGILNVTLDRDSDLGPLSGNVVATVNIGITKPIVMNADALAELFLDSFNVSATGPATIRVTLEDTGYAAFSGFGQLTNNLSVNQLDGATMTTTAYALVGSAVPDLGPDQVVSTVCDPVCHDELHAGALTELLPISVGTPTGALSGSGSSSVLFENSTSSPFSLFTQIVINFTEAGTVWFTQDMTVIQTAPLDPTPEPASLMLIATAVAGLAASRRRRSMSARR